MIYKDFDSFNSVLDEGISDLELILSMKKSIEAKNIDINSDAEESRKQLMERLSDNEKSIVQVKIQKILDLQSTLYDLGVHIGNI